VCSAGKGITGNDLLQHIKNGFVPNAEHGINRFLICRTFHIPIKPMVSLIGKLEIK
jgi:hypothetical protein